MEKFKLSLQRHGVKYVRYIVDGDNKIHKKLINDEPHGGDPEVEKPRMRTACEEKNVQSTSRCKKNS